MYATYSSVIAFDQLPEPTDTIQLVKKLGEGTYGSVHLAVDKRSGHHVHCWYLRSLQWRIWKSERGYISGVHFQVFKF